MDGNTEQFLLYDSDQQFLPSRMLIFSTRHNLQLLSQSQEWFSDGTFSTAPLLFEQLYTLHVVQYNTVVPVVYALLSNKTRDTYTKFIHALKILQPGLRPQQLMCDFEQAALQAFSNEFPGIQTTGCFFHLSQSVWRRVQTEGLKVSPLL